MRHPLLPCFVALLLTAAIGLIASGAFAQASRPPRLSPECRDAIMKLCPPAEGKGGRGACVRENMNKMSDKCQAEMKARRDAMEAWRKAHPEAEERRGPNARTPQPAQ